MNTNLTNNSSSTRDGSYQQIDHVIPQDKTVKEYNFTKRKKSMFIGTSRKKARTSQTSSILSNSSTVVSSLVTTPSPSTPSSKSKSTIMCPSIMVTPSRLSVGNTTNQSSGNTPNRFPHINIPNSSSLLVTPLVGLKRKNSNFHEQEKMRVGIEMLFKRVYYDTFTTCELTNIVTNICKTFNYHCRTTVTHVVLEVKKALDEGLEYDARRKSHTNVKRRKIQKNTLEEELLTELMERGNSYHTTTRLFNATYRYENNLTRCSVTAIYNAIQRCRHIVVSTEAIPQTDQNNQFHRQARFNWFCQLHARFGERVETPNVEGVLECRERLKDEWINKENLETSNHLFVPEQIAFWDEIHIYQVCGDHKDHSLIFARNENGLYDAANGSFDDTQRKVSFIHFYCIYI